MLVHQAKMLCEKAWVREASSILFKLAVFPGGGGGGGMLNLCLV